MPATQGLPSVDGLRRLNSEGTRPPVPKRGEKVAAFRSEWVAALPRNGWPPSIGMGGRFGSVYATVPTSGDLDRPDVYELGLKDRLPIFEEHLYDLAQVLLKFVEATALIMGTGPPRNVADEQIRLGVPLNDELERSHCCPPPCPMNDDLRGMRRGFERPELSDLLCLFGAECMPEIPSLWRSIYVVAPPLRASPHSEDGITPSRSAAPCSRTGRPVYWRNAPRRCNRRP